MYFEGTKRIAAAQKYQDIFVIEGAEWRIQEPNLYVSISNKLRNNTDYLIYSQ